MKARRGTTNTNVRGNSRDRAARRAYLLRVYAADVQMGSVRVHDHQHLTEYEPTCRCYRCGRLLTDATVTVDRIIPGCRGGKYVRSNIRPACAACNSETGRALQRR